MFLLHFLHQNAQTYNLTLTAAHLNHQWRPDADKDVQFCRQLCDRLGVTFTTSTILELNTTFKPNGSKEEMGRKYRRFFLEQVKKHYNADYIALAHHADDQQETFFIRLLRGTSLTGLTAMKAQEGHYIRPLLGVTKEQIMQYVHENNIAYVTDPTNNDSQFLRNRIRRELIPVLRKCDNRFDITFFSTLERLQETEDYLACHAQEIFKSISMATDRGIALNIPALNDLPPIMHYRMLVLWCKQAKVPFIVSQAFFDEILRFLKTSSANVHTVHEGWRLEKKNNQIFILFSSKDMQNLSSKIATNNP